MRMVCTLLSKANLSDTRKHFHLSLSLSIVRTVNLFNVKSELVHVYFEDLRELSTWMWAPGHQNIEWNVFVGKLLRTQTLA